MRHDSVTVAELIQTLRTMPPDEQVVLATDPEGNDFHPLGAVEVEPFWFDPDHKAISRTPRPDAAACRVLWPGN